MAPKSIAFGILLAAIVAAFFALTDASVLGIDLSAQFLKVASVRPKNPFHIVVDEQAKRKVPVAVAFIDGERHFGNNAVSFGLRKPLDTYLWAPRLLGKTIDSPQAAETRALFGYDLAPIPGRGGSVGIRMPKSDTILSPEELVAMSLQHVKKIAKDDSGIDMKDAVITVPAWFGQAERQAVLDAAEIAGVNVMALINDNTASAITYGVDRTYDNTTHTALFIDIGSVGFEATIVEYSGRKVGSGKSARYVGQALVKATAWDASLGGAAFDTVIRDALLNDFIAKGGDAVKDAGSNPRALAKLLKQAMTVKTVLSANTEIPVRLESVHKDVDLSTHFTRQRFYDLSQSLLSRVDKPLFAALAQAKLTPEALDAVVIIGGTVRIPGVQAAIKSALGKDKLDQNINGDEAMAMGAVFRAANVSGLFQVRPFGVVDVSNYPVNVTITDAEPATAAGGEEPPFSKIVPLFPLHNMLGKRKTIALTHSEDVEVALTTDASLLAPGTASSLGRFAITGVAALRQREDLATLLATQKPRVALSFVLSDSGVVSLAAAEATLEETVKVPKAKPSKDKKKASKDDKDAKEGEEAAAADDKAAEEAAEKKEEEPEVEYVDQKKVHRFPLTVTPILPAADDLTSFVPLTETTKAASRAFLDALTAKDTARRALAAARNDLEALIYSVRGETDDSDFIAVTTEAQREGMVAASRAAQDWMESDEGEAATTERLVEERAKLLAVIADARARRAEAAARPAALATAAAATEAARGKVSAWRMHKKWIPEDDHNAVTAAADELDAWVSEKVAAQAAAHAHEAPVFTAVEVHTRTKVLTSLVVKIDKKKKPVEPKPAANATATDNATAAENATDAPAASTEDAEATEAPVDTDAAAAAAAEPTEPAEPAAAAASSGASEAPAAAENKNKDEL